MRGVEILEGFWRETARHVRLGFMPAYVVLPLTLFALHIRYWTLGLLIVTIIVMMISERFGYTPPVALLALRAAIAGKLVKRRRSLFGKRLDN